MPCCNESLRTAIHNWLIISAVVRLRLNPCLPVEQKSQFKIQPTCDDTHSVPRVFSGIKTVSIQLPSYNLISHLWVPSDAICWCKIVGGVISEMVLRAV